MRCLFHLHEACIKTNSNLHRAKINNFALRNKAERNTDNSSTVRISIPFKDQVAANAVRRQLRDLSHKIGPTLCADQIETSTSPPPPPQANPGHLTIFLTGKAFPGVGNLTFAWVGWGKLNRKCQVSNGFFFLGAEVANSYKHVFGRDGRV